MDKYKTKLFLISAIFFAFMITPIHGHDEEMSAEEITVMIQEILSSVGDLGEKTLKDAKDVMATIKIETGHQSLPDLIEKTLETRVLPMCSRSLLDSETVLSTSASKYQKASVTLGAC